MDFPIQNFVIITHSYVKLPECRTCIVAAGGIGPLPSKDEFRCCRCRGDTFATVAAALLLRWGNSCSSTLPLAGSWDWRKHKYCRWWNQNYLWPISRQASEILSENSRPVPLFCFQCFPMIFMVFSGWNVNPHWSSDATVMALYQLQVLITSFIECIIQFTTS